MKKLALAALVVIAGIGSASAADMAMKAAPMMAPQAPVWNWTGSYFGLVGGGGWGTSRQYDITGLTTGNYSTSGGTFGGTSGLQIQYGSWVFGAESDLQWSNINGTVNTPICAGGSCFTNLTSYGTSRTRVGFAWDRWMVYGTGGIAYGRVRAGQSNCPAAGGNFAFCGSNVEIGWTAGAGIEAFFAPNWSAKIEYLYMDLGSHFSYAPAIPVFVNDKTNLVRAGINYRFNWGGPVVAKY